MGASRRGRIAAVSLLCAAGYMSQNAVAQQSASDAGELHQLTTELKQIESRIQALEDRQAGAQASEKPAEKPTAPSEAASNPAVSASGTAAASAPVDPPEKTASEPEAVKQAENTGMDTMDAGMGGDVINIPHLPEMKFRGFFDTRFVVANQNLAVVTNSPGSMTPATQGGNDTFTLGIMDLFVTSQITDHFSYLAEIGFQADTDTNGIGVDLERTQLSYTPNEKFSMNIGRSHAMLGYYNTAFHHGTWFQTTVDRPRIFEFEDEGGPLPIHNVGVEAMGTVPSGKLGLHWFAEVGNGKQTYALQAGPNPANVLGDHTGKSTNLGFLLRPDKLTGFQTGFNWYQAALVPVSNLLPGFGLPGFPFPDVASYYHQNLFVAHVIYITPKFEFMAEDAEAGDTPRGSTKPLYLSGGYAQISKAFGVVRPYFRYEWMNPNFRDPNNAWAGRWVGPLGGVRWDLNTFIAWKFEFQNTDWRNFSDDSVGNQLLPILHKTINQLSTQITYTF